MPFPAIDHDHEGCRSSALAAAEAECRRRGARLTDIRRRVLELVWDSHQAVGAYTLLERLGREGRAAAPPTVYRALDFLLAHGLIHRVERLNAFIGCPRPGHPPGGLVLLCRACGLAVEVEDAATDAALAALADRLGFVADRRTVDLEGQCPSCRDSPAALSAAKGRA